MKFGVMCMKMSFALRGNPARFLYSDALLNLFCDPAEIGYFDKEWGPIIWDVGASVGKYTVRLARSNPNATIFAFEPNLNSLYYLAYRTASYSNVVIVPNALTLDGMPIGGSYSPDFNAPPTGPNLDTISVDDAIRKFGAPQFVKMDVEGAEYDLLTQDSSPLFSSTVLASWHFGNNERGIPDLPAWDVEQVKPDITLLTPKAS